MPGGISTGLQKHSPDVLKDMEKPENIAVMKSLEQGAATTVWAAVSDDFKNDGGHYLENLTVTGPRDESDESIHAPGYAPHVFDQEKEDRLWKISNELVGFKEE
jgi:hypothetical protein